MEQFQAFRTSLLNQLEDLEAHCNDIICSVKLENLHLKKKLTEVQGNGLPHHEVPANEGVGIVIPSSNTSVLIVTPSPCHRPCSAIVPEAPGNGVEVHAEAAALLGPTPGRPGMSLSTNIKSHGVDIPQQPALDAPLTWVLTDEPEICVQSTATSGVEGTGTNPFTSVGIGDLAGLTKRKSKTVMELDKVTARWQRLASRIILPKEYVWFRVMEERLCLWPFWTVTSSTGETRVTLNRAMTKVITLRNTSISSLRVGSIIKSQNSCLQYFVIHPDHSINLANLLVQMALILFDVITVPMSVFLSGDSDFDIIVLYVSAIYWTWNMVLTFMVGFPSVQGVVDMRPAQIARHYFRRWFLFDLLVLVVDWSSLILYVIRNPGTGSSSYARATRITKAQRIFRACRVLRVFKASKRILHHLDTGASANWILMMSKILGLLGIIIIINHYVACAWYAIGDMSPSEDTWIKAEMIKDAPLFDRYFYSLHWSLTQFTPSTNNISPVSGVERFVACLIVLFALVSFSAFLSSLTSAIVNLKRLNADRYNERVQIREFLQRRKIPISLAGRVWHYYRTHYQLGNRICPESDIHFFTVLPKSLKQELHQTAYFPILQTHSLMKVLMVDGSRMSVLLCDNVSTIAPVSGQEVFLQGESTTCMYFMVHGRSQYSYRTLAKRLRAPDRIAEAVLWIKDWRHPGSLAVLDDGCELLLLNAFKFISCIEVEAADNLLKSLRKYASLLAQFHSDIQTQTDNSIINVTEITLEDNSNFWCPDFNLEVETDMKMIRKAFPFGALGDKKPASASFFQQIPSWRLHWR